MQIIGTPTVLAPHSTGHPGALPETPKTVAETGLIKPPASGANTTAAQERPVPQDSKAKPQKGRVAPPSALQIEIESMLAEQAEELAEMKQQMLIAELS
jgi:hypothetical protein